MTEDGWGADRTDQDLNAMLSGLPFLKAVYNLEQLPSPGLVPDTLPVDDPDAVGYLCPHLGPLWFAKCVMHSTNTRLWRTQVYGA